MCFLRLLEEISDIQYTDEVEQDIANISSSISSRCHPEEQPLTLYSSSRSSMVNCTDFLNRIGATSTFLLGLFLCKQLFLRHRCEWAVSQRLPQHRVSYIALTSWNCLMHRSSASVESLYWVTGQLDSKF